jgi:hypothetical protein
MIVVLHMRDGRIVNAIPCDEEGTLLENLLQPPPWYWKLKPGDQIKLGTL